MTYWLLKCACVLSACVFGLSSSFAASVSFDNVSTDSGTPLPMITISGDLASGDALRFEEAAAKAGSRAVVSLHSDGGNLEAGIAIGRAIHKLGFATMVTDTCASACALAWLAGRIRFAATNSRIGFHVAYNGTTVVKESGMGNALVGLYLGELGLGENVVRYVTTAPPDDMQWLSFRDASLLGIEVSTLDIDPAESQTATSAPQETEFEDQPFPGLDPANTTRATQNALTRYESAGISGLVESSKACWEVVSKKLSLESVQYCRALDLTGVMLNDAAKERFGQDAAISHFEPRSRVDELVLGLELAGITQSEAVLKLAKIWQEQFDNTLQEVTAQR